jgi:hypothetical protein
MARRAIVAALFVAAMAGPGVWPTASAESSGLIGMASAQGVRVTYNVPGYLVVETLVDGGGPAAQSKLDMSGSYVGFGALPYPGENVIAAPGLYGVATGQSAPAHYPFYVEANYPLARQAELTDPSGSYALKATANPKQVVAAAQFLPGSADALASGFATHTASTLDGSGKLTTKAESVTRGVDVKGVLQIAKVTSTSETVLAPGGKAPVTKTQLLIEGAIVTGQGVVIGPDGVKVAGQSMPGAPDDYSKQLNAALTSAGITVRTVRGDKVAGGSSSDVLEILSTQTVPVPGGPVGTLTYRIGSALSYVLGAREATAPLAVGGSLNAAGGSASDVQSSADAGQTDASSASSSSAVAGGVQPSAVAGGAGGAAATPSVSGSPSSTAARRASPALFARDLRSTTRWFYAVLAIGGAALLFAAALWRRKGVQATWLS